jgi:hypothetical protein
MSMTLPQFMPTASVPIALGIELTSGPGGFPEPLSFPFGSTGIRVFASPPCQRLLRLPSRKVLANRNSLSFPLQSSAPPVTTALWVVVSLRFIDLVPGFGCRTEVQFHFKGETHMANHKPQPVKTLRMAKLQVAIWENQGQKGPFHTVTVSRSYYDEEWKHTDNFTAGDLLTLAKLLDQAHSWIFERQAETVDS